MEVRAAALQPGVPLFGRPGSGVTYVAEVVWPFPSDAVLETLHRVFEMADTAMFVEDVRGTVLDVNRAAEDLFGMPRGAMVGRNIRELLPEPSRALLEPVREQLKREGRFEVEAWQAHRDGSPFLARVAGVLHRRPGGDLVLVAVRDVTADHMEREDLLGRIRELETFLYTVAHDLRTPLSALRGYAALLEQAVESGSGPDPLPMCRELRRQADRLARLLEDLLAFARIDREAPAEVPLDLASAARTAWQDLADRVALARAELELGGDLPRVNMAPVRLHQVLWNLFSNALRYRREGEPVRVRVARAERPAGEPVPEGFVCIEVADNGVGIPPEHVPRVFDLFYRADPSREGTGVGLAIVRRIVECAGGRVWVESQPGRGSRFFLVLPAADGGSP